jgi:uncharacterized membrane protein SpoIIM required for sporulation
MLNFWRASTTTRKRVLSILAVLLLSVAVTTAGILTPLSNEESQSLSKQLEQMQQDIRNMAILSSARTIFANNFEICLIMFVPIVGPFFGLYVLYNTGLVIGAKNATNGVPALLIFMLLFIFPFTWLEFFAYSIAFSESMWFTWRIVQRRAMSELRSAGILIGVCAGMLLAGAIIEAVIISLIG